MMVDHDSDSDSIQCPALPSPATHLDVGRDGLHRLEHKVLDGSHGAGKGAARVRVAYVLGVCS